MSEAKGAYVAAPSAAHQVALRRGAERSQAHVPRPSIKHGRNPGISPSRTIYNPSVTSRIPRFLFATVLMAISANFFLKYLWWSAFYSGSSGFAGHSQQVQNASARSTDYFWTVLLLELLTFAVVWSATKLRPANSSAFLWHGVRFAVSLALTIGGTALLALVFAWVQPGVH